MIEVVRAGPLTTVQDLGRPGLANLGVGQSGAADRPAARLANRLVGNDESAACLEVTLGGLAVRFDETATVAVTGAPAPVLVNGRPAALHAPIRVDAGETVELGQPERGVRTYLAVRGGITVEPVLGSRSTDMLSGLGPPVLAEGTRLALGDAGIGMPNVDVAPIADLPEQIVLVARFGPRDDWFTRDACHMLGSEAYEVTSKSDRIGLRLQGPALERSRTEELPSEGVVTGSLQVTADGMPVLLLVDHPVTGGYPVIAVVDAECLHLAAQVRPGERIRFRIVR